MSIDPIRHEYVVECSADRAFDAYANHMSEWWDPNYTANAETTSTLAQTRESPSEIAVVFTPDGERCRVVFEHVAGTSGTERTVRSSGIGR